MSTVLQPELPVLRVDDENPVAAEAPEMLSLLSTSLSKLGWDISRLWLTRTPRKLPQSTPAVNPGEPLKPRTPVFTRPPGQKLPKPAVVASRPPPYSWEQFQRDTARDISDNSSTSPIEPIKLPVLLPLKVTYVEERRPLALSRYLSKSPGHGYIYTPKGRPRRPIANHISLSSFLEPSPGCFASPGQPRLSPPIRWSFKNMDDSDSDSDSDEENTRFWSGLLFGKYPEEAYFGDEEDNQSSSDDEDDLDSGADQVIDYFDWLDADLELLFE